MKEEDTITNSCVTVEDATHLSEYGHTDVVVAGLINDSSQLVWRYWSSDGFLSGFRRETHRQVLLVRQQIRTGLERNHNHLEKSFVKYDICESLEENNDTMRC